MDKLWYEEDGKWTGVGSCLDPKDVFESIVFKLDDIVEFVRFSFYDKAYQASTDFRDNGHKYVHWQSYDSKFGRCFTLSLDQELTKYGLEGIAFNISRKSTINLHTPGLQSDGIHILINLLCTSELTSTSTQFLCPSP